MMPSYLLYQIKLSDDQFKEELFRELKYKTMTLKNEDAQLAVNAASVFNLYKLVALIAAHDIEEAFNVGNGYPSSSRSRIEKFRHAYSMSVGDVLIDIEAEKAYACCSYGWQQIDFTPTTYAA
jgi:hypothetical protein